MRTLALDVGDKRIGLALSDPTGLIATPITAVARTDSASDVRAVLCHAADNDVGEIIVGLPVSLSGNMGPQAKRVAAFTACLTGRSVVPVKSVDERFSSVEAARLLVELGVRPSRDRARVDSTAAALILQSYLDAKRSAGDQSSTTI